MSSGQGRGVCSWGQRTTHVLVAHVLEEAQLSVGALGE
jgi:hypothetical protein